MQPVASPVSPMPQAQMTPLPYGGQPMPAPVQGVQEAGRGGPLDAMMAELTPEQTSQLQQKMSSMSPEERMEYMTMLTQNWSQMGSDAGQDMSRADRLRQRAAPGREAGGMYVAANPLEHIARGMRNIRSIDDFDAAKAARGAAREGAQQTRASAADDYVANSRSQALRR
jgi:hypothetical protein